MGPSWTLSESDVVDLPLKELALEVLRDWDETDQWNFHNWLLSTNDVSRNVEVSRALSEAQNWLVSNGFLARGEPGQTSPEAGFITRLGRRALETGVLKEY